mgnify:CR=1 FL=1
MDVKSELLISYISNNPHLSSKEIFDGTAVLGISYATLKRILKGLVEENLISAVGDGKARKYILSPNYSLHKEIDLNEYFECNPIKLLEYSNNFIELLERCLLRKNTKNNRHKNIKLKGVDEEFYVNEIILDKILKN